MWINAFKSNSRKMPTFSFDLKSGYHHIEIASEHQTFLGFSWKFHQAEGCQYIFFGVAFWFIYSALHFHQMCSSLGKVFSFAGGKKSYLFGWWSPIENDYQVCKTLYSRIKEDLRRVGFAANSEKSIWEPVQSIVWLGFCWNSHHKWYNLYYGE